MRNAHRVTRHYVQHLEATAADVFPLICPVREAEWLDGFEYNMVYSASGVAETGCVFTTKLPGEPNTVWTITTHDPNKREVAFLRVTPDCLVTMLTVKLNDDGRAECTADITYTFTSLGPAGDSAIEGRHSAEGFLDMVQLWERSLNHYLRTGQTLSIRGDQ